MSEPFASIGIATSVEQNVKGPELPYFCPLCGVSYDVTQNVACYCHPRLVQ